MIKTFILSLGMLVAFPEVDATFEVSVADSQITWLGKKVGGQHTGTINVQSGKFTIDGDKLTGGSFVMDMGSIACTDLEGEYKGKLEGHLKSPDFFAVSDFPTASFVISKVTPEGDKHKIDGTIVIKNIAREISFPADVAIDGDKVTATAEIVIDRSKFDVRYGSGSFFDGLGDKLIYDDFTLNVQLVAAAK